MTEEPMLPYIFSDAVIFCGLKLIHLLISVAWMELLLSAHDVSMVSF
jgi:hypothetical protein